MGVLLFCLVAAMLLEPTEGEVCSRITDFTLFDPNNPDAEESCLKCQKCQPGQGLAVQCGSRVPHGTFTGCEHCEVNKTYSENKDISHCKPCNQCGFKIVKQQCTPLQNSKCADVCITGYKLDPILDACFPVPGNKPTSTSTKSPMITKVPTAIPSLASTTRSAETAASVGGIATNSTNFTKVDSRTKLQSKAVDNYTTTPSVVSQDSKILGISLSGVALITALIGFIYFVKKQRVRPSHSCEDVERGEEQQQPLTEFPNKDHLVNTSLDETPNGRTPPPFEDHSHKNSATTSPTESVPAGNEESTRDDDPNLNVQHIPEESVPAGNEESTRDDNPNLNVQHIPEESVPAGNEESTRDDDPNLDVQRIPEGWVVSDMERLRDNYHVMLHSVQKELDLVETNQRKTWRSVGRALGLNPQELGSIETCYLAQQSPTEALVACLKTRGHKEPKMREFVRALNACGRGDVARIIIDWPW